MSKEVKIWLIIASSLVLIGCIIFGSALSMAKFDFKKLQTTEFETNTHEITEKFNGISINTDTADITFLLSDSKNCKIECFEETKEKHLVSIKDDTLFIELESQKLWYEYIGINFSTPKITIYLPQKEYGKMEVKSSTGDIKIPKDFGFKDIDISLSTGDVNLFSSASNLIKIKTSTGDINIKNISAGSLDLSVSTGKISVSNVICKGNAKFETSTGKTELNDIKCKNLTSSGSTGNLLLNNVIAEGKLSIERDTGNVKFEACDAAEIFIQTDTGYVSGTLLSEKVFITETDTGLVSVPKTINGGKCEITTDTGNIRVSYK